MFKEHKTPFYSKSIKCKVYIMLEKKQLQKNLFIPAYTISLKKNWAA